MVALQDVHPGVRRSVERRGIREYAGNHHKVQETENNSQRALKRIHFVSSDNSCIFNLKRYLEE
jgi:hypothetical protein